MKLLLLLLVSAATAAPPPSDDSRSSADESHNSAYNSIISNYYTTDPFFEDDLDLAKIEGADVVRPRSAAAEFTDDEDLDMGAKSILYRDLKCSPVTHKKVRVF
jgi:hypothetical protein